MLKQRIEKIIVPGIIPVVRLDSGDDLYNLCGSFLQGGIRAVELTMTMPDALKHLSALKKHFKNALAIGMGTILSAEMARSALDAGAEFLVSPVPVADMAAVAHEYDAPVIMGAFTPHEAFTAHQYGADFVKIFPMSLTSPKYLKTICRPAKGKKYGFAPQTKIILWLTIMTTPHLAVSSFLRWLQLVVE